MTYFQPMTKRTPINCCFSADSFNSRLGKELSTMHIAMLFAAGLFVAIIAGFAKVEDSAY